VTGKPLPMAHNLLTLAKGVTGNIPSDIAAHVSFLNPHYTLTRYVDAAVGKPSDLFERSFAEDALRRAEEVLAWIEQRFLSTSDVS